MLKASTPIHTLFKWSKNAIYPGSTRLLRTTVARRLEIDGNPVPLQMQVKVDFLSQDTDDIMFEGYNPKGFLINNGVRIFGPCVAFPRAFLRWDVPEARMLTEDHLTLFRLLVPKPDVLIIGVGDQTELNHINPNIIRYLRMNKLNIEILSTPKALATFNFLNSEKRLVVAAVIPPAHVSVIDPEPKTTNTLEEMDQLHIPQKEDFPETQKELRRLYMKDRKINRLTSGSDEK